MDLSQQLAILRPRLRLIVLVTVIAGVLSFILASLIPKTYEAHTTLLVGQVYTTSQPSQPAQLNYDSFLASQELATTFAQLADTRPFLAAVATGLHLSDDPTALRDRVDAQAPPGSLFITVSARASSETSAADLANQVAKELLAEAPGILVGADATKAQSIVTVVDPAVASEAVKSPKVPLYAALGALTALIVAVATIFVLAYRESPPGRRAPAARRVGPPELSPINDGPSGSRPPVSPPEARPAAPPEPRPAPPSDPRSDPLLRTEVRRTAPVTIAEPAPLAESRPGTPLPIGAGLRVEDGPLIRPRLATLPKPTVSVPLPAATAAPSAAAASAPSKARPPARPTPASKPAPAGKAGPAERPAPANMPAQESKAGPPASSAPAGKAGPPAKPAPVSEPTSASKARPKTRAGPAVGRRSSGD